MDPKEVNVTEEKNATQAESGSYMKYGYYAMIVTSVILLLISLYNAERIHNAIRSAIALAQPEWLSTGQGFSSLAKLAQKPGMLLLAIAVALIIAISLLMSRVNKIVMIIACISMAIFAIGVIYLAMAKKDNLISTKISIPDTYIDQATVLKYTGTDTVTAIPSWITFDAATTLPVTGAAVTTAALAAVAANTTTTAKTNVTEYTNSINWVGAETLRNGVVAGTGASSSQMLDEMKRVANSSYMIGIGMCGLGGSLVASSLFDEENNFSVPSGRDRAIPAAGGVVTILGSISYLYFGYKVREKGTGRYTSGFTTPITTSS